MNRKITVIAAAVALTFGVAACSPPAPQADAGATEAAAPGTVAGPIRSTGKVKAIDAASGSITLDHAPIEAIKWGAMTMEFKASDPTVLQGVAVGDQVTFELKSAADPQTVTMVQKQ